MREEFGTQMKEHEKSDPETACHDKETLHYYNALCKEASVKSEPSSTAPTTYLKLEKEH